jgi:Sec-independent protein secretion pathway component TatC
MKNSKKNSKIIYFFFFDEIKNRGLLLFITAITVVLSSYLYKEALLFSVCSKSSFSYIYTNITEIFSTYVKLISFITNQVVLIYFFFHCFVFLSPGLYDKEYIKIKVFFYFNIFTTIFSICFFNIVLFPISCDFFLSFQNTIFKPLNFYFEAKITDYFNFYIGFYYLCFFYVQVFIFLICFFYILDQRMEEIKFYRKLFYFLFFIFSIFISYFDVALQVLLFINLLLFYEITILKFLLTKNLTN